MISLLGLSQNKQYNFNEESEKVLQYYKENTNPLKLQAAEFLLNNIHTRKSVLAKWYDKNGKSINFNESDFTSFEVLKKETQRLSNQGAIQKLIIQKDDKYLNADFLIDNIDYAFKVWEQSLWKNNYNFNTFLEYILPYRNGKEPVRKGWRKDYNVQYKTALANAEDSTDPISVLRALIDEMGYFDFKLTRENPQPLLSLDQLNLRKVGSCPDLANSVSMIARSLGIATTFDFTPYHAASSNSHFWNTVINKEGEHIPFSSNQQGPYEYDLSVRRIGKALRITYSEQENVLANKVPRNLIPIENLSLKNAIDVTHEYVNTYNVPYTYSEQPLGNVGYLCVYNKGKWKPTWWSMVNKNKQASFSNMGSNLMYLPAQIELKQINSKKRRSLTFEKYPIFLNNKGKSKVLKPNFKETFDCQVSRRNEHIDGSREFNTLEMIEDTYLNLEYWEEGWKVMTKVSVIDESICLENLPSNALFRLTPEKPDNFERIFVIDEPTCKIIWY